MDYIKISQLIVLSKGETGTDLIVQLTFIKTDADTHKSKKHSGRLHIPVILHAIEIPQ